MLAENQQQEQQLYYNFYIFTDSGSCLYKIISSENNDENLSVLQGIIQALFFSGSDSKCELKMITTDLGVLSYKAFTNEKNTLLFILIFPNFYGDEKMAEIITGNLLEFIYHVLLIHIGTTDLFSFKTPNDIEKLRRYIEMYQNSIKYIINNHNSLTFLLKAERKYELDNNLIYSIKYYLEQLKQKIKVDLICLTVKNIVLWASSDWLSIDINDRILFIIISELYGDTDYNEIPIYFSKTPLEDEGIGRMSYKLFSINLMKDTKIIILSDNDLTISRITFDEFDDFFISKIMAMKNNLKIDVEIITQNVKCIIIYNKYYNTYKFKIDDSFCDTMQKFILNCSFSEDLFKNESDVNLNEDEEESNTLVYNQFYAKNENNEIFYYFRTGNLIFMILFKSNTTFDDINNTKLILEQLKDTFDNTENYKDIDNK